MKRPIPSGNALVHTVVLALFGALLFVVQVALSWAPNVELVTVLVLLLAVTYGWRALVPLYLFVLMEGLFYGFNLWFINYLYVWLLPLVLGVLFRRRTSRLFWACVAGLCGLTFGTLCSIPMLFMGGVPSMVGYIVSGLGFDAVHAVGNFVSTLVLLPPLRAMMQKLDRSVS